MDVPKEVLNLSQSSAIVAASIFIAMIGPGLILVAYYDRSLFDSADALKLTLFAASITAPATVIPLSFTVFFRSVLASREPTLVRCVEPVSLSLIRHCINNAATLYILIATTFLLSLTLSSFIAIYAFSIFASCILEVITLYRRLKSPESYIPLDLR